MQIQHFHKEVSSPVLLGSELFQRKPGSESRGQQSEKDPNP